MKIVTRDLEIPRKPNIETLSEMNKRNSRVQGRYDELMAIGDHGHYETMFRIIKEEVELASEMQRRAECFDELREALYGLWIANCRAGLEEDFSSEQKAAMQIAANTLAHARKGTPNA